ncbi:MAG: hypothetical protein ACE5FC_00265 [Myxococcota bacterium]
MEKAPALCEKGRFLTPVLLFLGACLLYFPTLGYDFTVDDPLLTIHNAALRDFSGDYAGFFDSNLYAGTSFESGNAYVYRPLLMASIALDYQLAGHTIEASRFHLTNVLLYAALIAVLYLLLRALQGKARPAAPAFLVALLFMVFPSHSEVVCNVKNREEILALLFGAVSWWLIARDWAPGLRASLFRGIAAPLFFLLALLSKESALLLLPVMALWRRLAPAGAGGRAGFPFIPFTLAAIAYFLLRRHALGFGFDLPERTLFFTAEDGLLARVLTAAPVFVKYYLWDQLLGLELNPSFSTRFLVPVVQAPAGGAVASLIGLSVLFLVALRIAWTRGAAPALWGVFFFVTSLLALQIVPLGTAGAFRLMFTPSLGLCAVLGAALGRAAWPGGEAGSGPSRRPRALGAGMILVVVVSYAATARARSANWRNDGTLYAYAAEVAPGDPMSRYAAAEHAGRAGRADERRAYLEEALAIFVSRQGEPAVFDERALDAFSVAATEVAYGAIDTDAPRAIALSDLAIGLFERLRALRGGAIDANAAAPYYVKARALARLARYRESRETCRAGLALARHPGLERLLQELSRRDHADPAHLPGGN